jgi:hypothetical protein
MALRLIRVSQSPKAVQILWSVMSFIPAVLGVDAMTIEPYSGLSKPPESLEVEERYSSLFVYYIQPLDRQKDPKITRPGDACRFHILSS